MNEDKRKNACNRLAALLQSDAAEGVRCLLELFPRKTQGAPVRSERVERGPARAGIWQEVARGSKRFVRAVPNGEPITWWANVDRIEPKAGCRVVLLGESVARGFFLDPHYNPAMMLGDVLRECSATDTIEVVDLARTDLSFDRLLQLMNQSLVLDPDVLVVFAGNNWHPLFGSAGLDLAPLAGCVRDAMSWMPVRSWLDSLLRRRAATFVRLANEISQRKGIACVFVLPEFNLLDWRDPGWPPPLLPASALREWMAHRAAAVRSLEAGDFESAERSGRTMLALDGGISPASSSSIGRALIGLGRHGEARQYLEQARDALSCLPVAQTPRCSSVLQEAIRLEAAAAGMPVVDLPALFQKTFGPALPDRRLFYDYCHLTVEGMSLAVTETAARVLPLLGNPSRMGVGQSGPSPKTVAASHLLAAIHNAKWDQSRDVVAHHLRLAASSGKSLAQSLLDMYGRRAPTELCLPFARMQDEQSRTAARSLFNPPHRPKRLMLGLLNAVEEMADAPSQDRIDNLLVAEHALNGKPVALHAQIMAAAAVWNSNDDALAYYRSRDTITSAVVICREPDDLELRITMRARFAGAGSSAAVYCNGELATYLQAPATWTDQSLCIPKQSVRRGCNYVEIHWPEPVRDQAAAVAEAACALARGRRPEVLPIFGEIYTFTAQARHPVL